MSWLLPTSTPPPADSKEALVQAIDRALSIHIVHSNVGKAVDQCFLYVRAQQNAAGERVVNVNQVLELAPRVAQELHLPAWLFDNILQEAQNFDFNGDGVLDLQEAKRLFKKILQQKRLEYGGRKDPKVPFMSVDEAGYTVVKELGRGGQGAMYLCTKRSWMTTTNYCVKFYNKADSNAGGLNELLDEYELMMGMNNDHIAKTYAVFQDRQFFYLVNEPYFGGDLTKLGKKAFDEGISMSESWWRPIFKQCMEGLSYLHGNGVMHCDIKEPNIMIADGNSYRSPRPVLIDFGLSAAFTANREGVCGTPGYIPPETWQCGMWFPRGDTFSMGIVFFQLCAGQVPSKNGTVQGVLQSPMDGDYGRAAAKTPLPWNRFPQWPLLQNLVEAMTSRDRGSRPLPAQVLNHTWFTSNSNYEMPANSLQGLVGVAHGHSAHEEAATQLTKANDLNDLQTMLEKFQRADPTGQGVVDPHVAKQVLAQHGVDPQLASQCTDNPQGFAYSAMATDAITAKHQFSFHFIKDLFDRLDADKSGKLSVTELRQLLGSRAFECSQEQMEQLVAWMDTDGDGEVNFEEFARAALEYGKIANRSDVDNTILGALGVPGALASLGIGGQKPPEASAAAADAVPGWDGQPQPPWGAQPQPGDLEAPPIDYSLVQAQQDPFRDSTWNLRLTVVGARGLLDSAAAGASCNPFCTVGLSSAEFGAFQTRVLRETGEPVWNMEEDVLGYAPGDGLDFALLSAPGLRPGEQDEVIGTASLACERFFPHGFDSEVTILGPGTGIRGLLRIQVAVWEEANEYAAASGAYSDRPLYRSGLGWSSPPAQYTGPVQQQGPRVLSAQPGGSLAVPAAAPASVSMPPASSLALNSLSATSRGYSVYTRDSGVAVPATVSGLPQVYSGMQPSYGSYAAEPQAAGYGGFPQQEAGLPPGSMVSWGRSWTEQRPATVTQRVRSSSPPSVANAPRPAGSYLSAAVAAPGSYSTYMAPQVAQTPYLVAR